MSLSFSFFISKQSEDVYEKHDDVQVEHKCSDNVVIHAALNIVAGDALSSTDHHGVDDQVEAIQEYSQKAIDSVKDRNFHENTNDGDW
jgi:hypothetical protein